MSSKIRAPAKRILGQIFGIRSIYKFYLYLLSFSKVAVRLRGIRRTKIMDEDWDYLIVLDACRYDYFKKENTIKGVLERKTSAGSCTPEWLKANFTEYYDDVVYVSGNPYISNVKRVGFKGSEHFYRVEPCWDYGWDPETGTVHPQSVVAAALKAKKRFPNKRMIIHFMQPHAPYIGRTRIPLKSLMTQEDKHGGVDPARTREMHVIWRKVRSGQIPIDVVKRAYIDNLKLVLNEVAKLLEHLDGRIVITADHGECFQEYFLTAHPWGIYLKQLTDVPWLVIEKPKNREPALSPSESEKERIRRKVMSLRSLGKI